MLENKLHIILSVEYLMLCLLGVASCK